MFRTFQVEHDERALLFRKGRLVAVLRTGQHEYFDPLRRLAAQAFSPAQAALDPGAIAGFARADRELVEREFHDVRLGATEVGLRYHYGELVEVLAPGTRRVVFKAFGDVRVARFDIAKHFTLPYSLTLRFGDTRSRARIAGAEGVLAAEVPRNRAALLFVDGRRHLVLRPGQHAFFRFGRDLRIEIVDVAALAGESHAAAQAGTPLALRDEPACA